MNFQHHNTIDVCFANGVLLELVCLFNAVDEAMAEVPPNLIFDGFLHCKDVASYVPVTLGVRQSNLAWFAVDGSLLDVRAGAQGTQYASYPYSFLIETTCCINTGFTLGSWNEI
jgi:hypothetical protein